MKIISNTILCIIMINISCFADEPAHDNGVTKQPTDQNNATQLRQHGEKAQSLSIEQDELSADVQDLIDEQTDPEVIKMLREIELVMADATDLLDQKNTGGATIATETEVIEKIFEAAKKKQQNQKKDGGSQNSQKSMGSMLDMLKNMMDGGKDVGEGQQPGQQEGKQQGKDGQQPGQGGQGGSQTGEKVTPDNTAEKSERRVPRKSGTAGSSLPREFHQAMDAYNRGAINKTSEPSPPAQVK